MKKAIKKIEELVFKGRQSSEYRLIYTLESNDAAFKVRIDIDVDSYDFQSSAIAKVWNANSLEWKVVYSIPYKEMASIKTAKPYGAPPAPSQFREDVARIQKQVSQILL